MKTKDYRDMGAEDLKKEIEGITKSLFDLRFKKVTDVVENPAEFRKLRRERARAKTILREKELSQPRSAPAVSAAVKPATEGKKS